MTRLEHRPSDKKRTCALHTAAASLLVCTVAGILVASTVLARTPMTAARADPSRLGHGASGLVNQPSSRPTEVVPAARRHPLTTRAARHSPPWVPFTPAPPTVEPDMIEEELSRIRVELRPPSGPAQQQVSAARGVHRRRHRLCVFVPTNADDDKHASELEAALDAWVMAATGAGEESDAGVTPFVYTESDAVVDALASREGGSPWVMHATGTEGWREGHYRRILGRNDLVEGRHATEAKLQGRGLLTLPLFVLLGDIVEAQRGDGSPVEAVVAKHLHVNATTTLPGRVTAQDWLRHFVSTLQSCAWFMKVDTDTFLRPERFAATVLRHRNPDTEPLAIGRLTTFSTAGFNVSEPALAFDYPVGGTGYTLSRAALLGIDWHRCMRRAADESVLLVHDDAAVGFCAAAVYSGGSDDDAVEPVSVSEVISSTSTDLAGELVSTYAHRGASGADAWGDAALGNDCLACVVAVHPASPSTMAALADLGVAPAARRGGDHPRAAARDSTWCASACTFVALAGAEAVAGPGWRSLPDAIRDTIDLWREDDKRGIDDDDGRATLARGAPPHLNMPPLRYRLSLERVRRYKRRM
jgi:hypothetical protein